MSEAQKIIRSIQAARPQAPNTLTWTAAEATRFSTACSVDAHDYWYSGLVSIGDALRNVQANSYVWATVKAYYSSFYLSRAWLGFTGTIVEFVQHGSKKQHYMWRCSPGDTPDNLKGNTHDAVLRYVDRTGAIGPLRGQHVAGVDVGQWLIEQRNAANYSIARFSDPGPTACMTKIASFDPRRLLKAYIDDTIHMYTFDNDHAILAYPLAIASLLAKRETPSFSRLEIVHLATLFRDRTGPFSFMKPLFQKAAAEHGAP